MPIETKTIYARVSKTLAERLARYVKTSGKTEAEAFETLLRVGLFVEAMPEGAEIIRRRKAILGLDEKTGIKYVAEIDKGNDPSF